MISRISTSRFKAASGYTYQLRVQNGFCEAVGPTGIERAPLESWQLQALACVDESAAVYDNAKAVVAEFEALTECARWAWVRDELKVIVQCDDGFFGEYGLDGRYDLPEAIPTRVRDAILNEVRQHVTKYCSDAALTHDNVLVKFVMWAGVGCAMLPVPYEAALVRSNEVERDVPKALRGVHDKLCQWTARKRTYANVQRRCARAVN